MKSQCLTLLGGCLFRLSVLVSVPASAQTSEQDATMPKEAPSVAPNRPLVSAPRRTKPNGTKESNDSKREPARTPSEAAAGAPAQFGPPPPGEATLVQGSAGSSSVLSTSPSSVPPLSASPSVSASASALPPAVSAVPPAEPVAVHDVVEVRIRDTIIFRLKIEDGGLIPAERAKRATRAIESALADTNPEAVRTELRQDRALLFIGQRPIIELTRADAEAIGEGSLEMFAASAAARVNDVLESERQRSVVTHSLFNITFVIFLAVVVLYALRALGGLARKTREFVRRNPDRIPAIRLRSIEVIGPHVLRSGIVVGIGVLRLLLQLGLIFAWLLFSSSLFEATRGLTDKLTALVLSPLSGLATRFAALLPLLLLTTIGIVVLVILLRFVALFFAGVERRETELTWLRPELAAPTSLLIRIGLVVFALLVLAPLVTGNVDGSLARVGMLSMVAIALATTPFAANIVVGLVTLYGGRLKLGDEIRIGSQVGTLTSVDLVELRLALENGQELRVPHLVTLVQPLVVATQPAGIVRRLLVTAEERFERLVEVLSTAEVFELTVSVSVIRIEAERTTVELLPKRSGVANEQQLLIVVARSLATEEVRVVLAEWRYPA